MKRLASILAVTLIIALAGCQKEDAGCTIVGTVLWRGPVPTDGCDWVIRSGQTDFHPTNLPASYQQDSLRINFDWNLTGDTFICGWAVKMPEVEINCIERQ